MSADARYSGFAGIFLSLQAVLLARFAIALRPLLAGSGFSGGLAIGGICGHIATALEVLVGFG